MHIYLLVSLSLTHAHPYTYSVGSKKMKTVFQATQWDLKSGKSFGVRYPSNYESFLNENSWSYHWNCKNTLPYKIFLSAVSICWKSWYQLDMINIWLITLFWPMFMSLLYTLWVYIRLQSSWIEYTKLACLNSNLAHLFFNQIQTYLRAT